MNWKSLPDSVGDWIEIEVWNCGCIHQIQSHEFTKEHLEIWLSENKEKDDVFFLKVDLPPRKDGVMPCRSWREKTT